MADSEQRENEQPKRSSTIGRFLIVAFMGAVVVSECLFAYFWLPSADEVAAQMQLVAQKAQADASGDQENSADQDESVIEVDLGTFTITNHRLLTESTFRTDFHLWGTIPEDQASEFEALFTRNKNRFRNLVIEEIHNSEVADLVDPGLGLIKRRFLEKSNALFGKPILRSVVFADYTFVEL
jgi:flagellar FliL protein